MYTSKIIVNNKENLYLLHEHGTNSLTFFRVDTI